MYDENHQSWKESRAQKLPLTLVTLPYTQTVLFETFEVTTKTDEDQSLSSERTRHSKHALSA